MAEDKGLTFPVLRDPGGEVIGRYGLTNEAFTRGVLPHPAVLVVDRDGTVAWKRVDVDYRQRPPASEVVAAVETLSASSDDTDD
jgi:peroxiredoxin